MTCSSESVEVVQPSQQLYNPLLIPFPQILLMLAVPGHITEGSGYCLQSLPTVHHADHFISLSMIPPFLISLHDPIFTYCLCRLRRAV